MKVFFALCGLLVTAYAAPPFEREGPFDEPTDVHGASAHGVGDEVRHDVKDVAYGGGDTVHGASAHGVGHGVRHDVKDVAYSGGDAVHGVRHGLGHGVRHDVEDVAYGGGDAVHGVRSTNRAAYEDREVSADRMTPYKPHPMLREGPPYYDLRGHFNPVESEEKEEDDKKTDDDDAKSDNDEKPKDDDFDDDYAQPPNDDDADDDTDADQKPVHTTDLKTPTFERKNEMDYPRVERYPTPGLRFENLQYDVPKPYYRYHSGLQDLYNRRYKMQDFPMYNDRTFNIEEPTYGPPKAQFPFRLYSRFYNKPMYGPGFYEPNKIYQPYQPYFHYHSDFPRHILHQNNHPEEYKQ